MSYNNIIIKKGGELFADKWNPNERKSEKNVNITDKYLYHLTEECEFEDGLTFKDIMLLIKNIDAYDVLSPILTYGPWLKDLIDEGLSEKPDKKKFFDKIIIGWRCAVVDDYEGGDYLETYVQVNGIKNDSDDRWAVSYTPLNEMAECEISLNSELLIYDDRHDTRGIGEEYCPTLIGTKKRFTLFNILYGIFWELSFHGGPKERDKKSEELSELVDKIKNGEEKMIPWEEVKENLEKKINNIENGGT